MTFAIFQDKRFNGRAFSARSSDNGASFTRAAAAHRRHHQPALRDRGDRSRRPGVRRLARQAQRAPPRRRRPALSRRGAGLCLVGRRRRLRRHAASPSTIPANAAAWASPSPGRAGPSIAFRNIFAGSIRDHAVVTFKDAATPGPLRRVSVDDWKIEACPHQGPSLAIAPDGVGARRLVHRRRRAQGPVLCPRRFGRRRLRPAARPLLARSPAGAALSARRRPGAASRVEGVRRHQGAGALAGLSHDSGRTWSAARTVADTDDASDHPLLVAHAGRAYLSWLTKAQGYRLIPLEDQP